MQGILMIRIRAVTEGDTLQIVDLLNPIIARRTLTTMDRAIAPEEQRAFIRAFPPAGIFHAAVGENGRIVGIQDVVPAALCAGLGEISTFVRLGHQGTGIGRALSGATLREARRNGFDAIRATVRADNARAAAFYRGQGFRPVGTLSGYARIDGRDVDALILERRL